MVWRKSSAMEAFLARLADVLRQLPPELLDTRTAASPPPAEAAAATGAATTRK
jgi:LysR family hydrogen peroxide-inducible transcriptional activator